MGKSLKIDRTVTQTTSVVGIALTVQSRIDLEGVEHGGFCWFSASREIVTIVVEVDGRRHVFEAPTPR